MADLACASSNSIGENTAPSLASGQRVVAVASQLPHLPLLPRRDRLAPSRGVQRTAPPGRAAINDGWIPAEGVLRQPEGGVGLSVSSVDSPQGSSDFMEAISLPPALLQPVRDGKEAAEGAKSWMLHHGVRDVPTEWASPEAVPAAAGLSRHGAEATWP